jgi:Zn-finger nucleic acid-binding protein
MKCPNDRTDMVEKKLGSILLEECPSCGGIWFEKGELQFAKDALEPDINWMEVEVLAPTEGDEISKSKKECPKDGTGMFQVPYGKSGVNVDVCPACEGIWLDNHELEKIISALVKESQTTSSSEYFRETMKEAMELVTGSEGFLSEWKDFSTVFRMLQYRILSEHPRLLETLNAFNRSNPLK